MKARNKHIRILAASIAMIAAAQSLCLTGSAVDGNYTPLTVSVSYNPLAPKNMQRFSVNLGRKDGKDYYYDCKRNILIANGNMPMEVNSSDGQTYWYDYTLMMKNAAAAWDFYDSLGWSGYSGTSLPLYLKLETNLSSRSNPNSASADVNTIKIGVGDKVTTQNWATDVDTITHEFTHLVTGYKLGWDGGMAGETFCLAEAYSDIMGELADPTRDWKIATDQYLYNIKNNTNRYCQRDLANPFGTQTPYQDSNGNIRFLNNNFYSTYPALRAAFYNADGSLKNLSANQNAYDHSYAAAGSTLISHAAYLMMQMGITESEMKTIWYRSMDKIKDMTEETRFATFSDCRKAVIAALDAIDLSRQATCLRIIKDAFDQAQIYIRGDVNDDGLVDAKDLKMLDDYLNNRYWFNINYCRQFGSADVNYDNRVDQNDYRELRAMLYTAMTQNNAQTNLYAMKWASKKQAYLTEDESWIVMNGYPNAPDESVNISFPDGSHDGFKSNYVTINTTFFSGYMDQCNVAYEEPYYECAGFAKKLQYDYFGTTKYLQLYDLQNYQPKIGDHLRVQCYSRGHATSEHSIFITSVNGDTFTYADCNSSGYCEIQWGHTMTMHRNAAYTFTNENNASFEFVWVERPMMQGDVNGDGMVDSQDISEIGRVINGTAPTRYRNTRYRNYAADMNCDGVVDVRDTSALRNFVAAPWNYDYGYLK